MTTQMDELGWVPTFDEFGARLAAVRNKMGWNAKEAALACGIAQGSWREWEVRNRLPTRLRPSGREDRRAHRRRQVLADDRAGHAEWTTSANFARTCRPTPRSSAGSRHEWRRVGHQRATERGEFRVHEIAKFHGSQIDHEAHTVEVEGKGGVIAVLPAPQLLLDHAKRMPHGYWFPSQRRGRKHLGGRAISEKISIHMIRCRVPGKPHCLRHYFGTELVEGGADLRVAQELLRHLSLATTAIYVQASDRRKREAIDRLDPFANAA